MISPWNFLVYKVMNVSRFNHTFLDKELLMNFSIGYFLKY